VPQKTTIVELRYEFLYRNELKRDCAIAISIKNTPINIGVIVSSMFIFAPPCRKCHIDLCLFRARIVLQSAAHETKVYNAHTSPCPLYYSFRIRPRLE